MGPVARLLAAAVLAVGLLAAIGAAPLGRVLLAAGMPGAALPLLDDPADRGEALFRAGAFHDAAAAFQAAGDDYNHGLAAAWSGDYATALVAWDRYLALNPGDAEARANHALVTGLLAGTEFEPVGELKTEEKTGPELLTDPGQGGARAAGSGDDANNAQTGFWMPELNTDGIRSVRQTFDAQFVAANARWLATLEDQPGRYLRARLKAEQKERVENGTARPEPEDPQ